MKTLKLKFLLIVLCTLALCVQSCSDDNSERDSELQAIELNGTLEEDQARIDEMLNNIMVTVENIPCTDEENWKSTPLGYRFCGTSGPAKYIAYSIEMETSAFLEKVEIYRLSQKALIEKWDLASTCELIAVPQDVRCENNQPILVY